MAVMAPAEYPAMAMRSEPVDGGSGVLADDGRRRGQAWIGQLLGREPRALAQPVVDGGRDVAVIGERLGQAGQIGAAAAVEATAVHEHDGAQGGDAADGPVEVEPHPRLVLDARLHRRPGRILLAGTRRGDQEQERTAEARQATGPHARRTGSARMALR
jgi:hypothetical protein